MTQNKVEEFFDRQMEHKKKTERKLSTQRQEREDKEHEQLTFTPATIAKEMKGVDSVVGSFSRKCSVRPKPDAELGHGASARGGATSRSPDPVKGLAALSRKNSRAI